MLAGAVAMCIILSLVCGLAAFALMKTADNETDTAKVALVTHEGRAGGFLITAVENAYLSSLMETTEFKDEQAALESVKNGESVAAIVLPEGFIDNLSHGIKCEGKIYLSNRARTQSKTIRSIVNFGERLMMAGQYGVFAGEQLIVENGYPRDVRLNFNDSAYNDLLNEALNFNSKYFTFETVDYHGTGMPTESYFILCWLLLLMFLLSLFFIPLFLADCNQGMLNRLYAYGVGPVRFMRGKLALMVITRAVIIAAAILLLKLLASNEIIVIPLEMNAINIILVVLGIAFVTLIGAALTMCFGDGITSNVLSGLLGMFLCGGIVPRPMLPDAVLTIGRLTPFGAAKALFEPLFGAEPDVAALASAVVYAVIAVLLIKRKLELTVSGRN